MEATREGVTVGKYKFDWRAIDGFRIGYTAGGVERGAPSRPGADRAARSGLRGQTLHRRRVLQCDERDVPRVRRQLLVVRALRMRFQGDGDQ